MELWEVLLKRHSVRSYEIRKVEQELLERVLTAGSLAPVGMGQYENVHFTVVTRPSLLEKIDQATAAKIGKEGAHPIYGAPLLVVVSSRPGKFVIPGIEKANCGCIMENMMLAAANEGLGSVYLLAATEALCENPDMVAELNLPEGFTPVAMLGLGYPSQEGQEKQVECRIEVNEVV